MSQTLRNWRESVIQKGGLIGDVVRNLNASGLRICLVLDDDKKLEKKLRKHGIDPDRMLETAKKLIKAHERKLLREAKPKYKH